MIHDGNIIEKIKFDLIIMLLYNIIIYYNKLYMYNIT